MIRKLQIKFTLLSMLSLLLVLSTIMAGINLLNYHGIIKDADTMLALIDSNNGTFPMMEPETKVEKEGKKVKKEGIRHISPESPFETRFFSILMDDRGDVLTVDTGKIAAIDTSEAIQYAQDIFFHGTSRGFEGNYRYLKQSSGQGIRITFLDCRRNLETFSTFLFTSIGISLLGLLAVFCLITLFSGRVVKPVSESYEKQKQFITDAGHEIKTPLAIIRADTDVLEMEIGENEWLSDIQTQTRRLAELTENLTCLARMEENHAQFQMAQFSISEAVQEAARSFQALAKTQDKAFTIQIQPMLSFYGDEKTIRQLTAILLDNALKYSNEHGQIALTLEKQGHTLCLIVSNTTASLPEGDLGQLFDRFYRADPSRNSTTRGYGLGLSIAKVIVSAHKGKITAAAKDGHSLQLTALFPV